MSVPYMGTLPWQGCISMDAVPNGSRSPHTSSGDQEVGPGGGG